MNIICIFKNFLEYEPLPELMQGAGIAIITLLISFAIGILIHHLGDKEHKGGFLDIHVALDYVWRFKQSLFLIVIVVISPFLFSVESLGIKALVFIIWAISIGLLIYINVRLYYWVKGDKDDFRMKYLSNFPKSPRDKIVSWGDFWSTDINKGKRFTEPDFFSIFSKEIDALLNSDNKEDWETLSKLLDDFVEKIELRNKTFLVVFDEFFPKILEWHYIIWEKQFTQYSVELGKANPKIDTYLFQIDQLIDKTIKFVTSIALTTGNAFSYFDRLKNHIKKYEDRTIIGTKLTYQYIQQIPIYEDCLNLISKSPEAYNIWNDYFPESWKITIYNLENNKISNLWYSRFLNWSQSRIWDKKEEWDKELDEVSKSLFPDVDPITWAKIYTFVIRPFSSDRMKSIIESKINFGYIGRVYSGWGDDVEISFAKQQQEELENTIKLAKYLFGKVFTKENIENWIKELEKLEYPKDSDENRKKEYWKALLNKLKNN